MANRDEPLKTKRRYVLVYLFVGALLFIVGSIVALFVFVVSVFGIYSEGSPQLAALWAAEMSSWDSPEDAANDATVQIIQLSQGEWAIVRSKNSHGGLWSGGGTVVIKDSSGQLQAFHHGHICGDGNPLIANEYDDLPSFYKALTNSDFREFEID